MFYAIWRERKRSPVTSIINITLSNYENQNFQSPERGTKKEKEEEEGRIYFLLEKLPSIPTNKQILLLVDCLN